VEGDCPPREAVGPLEGLEIWPEVSQADRRIDTQLAQTGLEAKPRPGGPGTQIEDSVGIGPPERRGQVRRDGVEDTAPFYQEPTVIADPLANAPRVPSRVGDFD
jgi:hypothetical protein